MNLKHTLFSPRLAPFNPDPQSRRLQVADKTRYTMLYRWVLHGGGVKPWVPGKLLVGRMDQMPRDIVSKLRHFPTNDLRYHGADPTHPPATIRRCPPLGARRWMARTQLTLLILRANLHVQVHCPIAVLQERTLRWHRRCNCWRIPSWVQNRKAV
eukprot:3816136-Amphidinium_carterae.2